MIDPAQARIYIDNYARFIQPGCTHVLFMNGDRIYFNHMTDEEAILAADELGRIEIAFAEYRKKEKDN